MDVPASSEREQIPVPLVWTVSVVAMSVASFLTAVAVSPGSESRLGVSVSPVFGAPTGGAASSEGGEAGVMFIAPREVDSHVLSVVV